MRSLARLPPMRLKLFLSVDSRESGFLGRCGCARKAATLRSDSVVEQKAVLKQRGCQHGLSQVYSSPAVLCVGEGSGGPVCTW